jgi:DNA-binding NarL/FixJ family response regulator
MVVEDEVLEAAAGRVYGAALAVAEGADAALEVSRQVLEPAVRHSARTGAEPDGDDLVAQALLLAVRRRPAAPFVAMTPEQREVAALARPGGLAVPSIARRLGLPEAIVKARMRGALRAVARAGALS